MKSIAWGKSPHACSRYTCLMQPEDSARAIFFRRLDLALKNEDRGFRYGPRKTGDREPRPATFHPLSPGEV